MKAAVFQGVNKPLIVEDIQSPEPAGPHDVVVRVARCGICGSDLHISEEPIFGVPAGVVLGHEYSGEIVFECVGKTGVIQRCIEHVAPRGTVIVVGLCTHPDTFNPFLLVAKECRLQPTAFYTTQDFHTTLDVLESRESAPHSMITDTITIDEIPEAFEALKQRTTQCKVLIDSWNS